jgi:predicted HicB family RNase H-like nuclease
MGVDMEKIERKKFIFDVAADMHKQVKIYAARRGISMNNWLQRAVYERIQKEMKYDKDHDGNETTLQTDMG